MCVCVCVYVCVCVCVCACEHVCECVHVQKLMYSPEQNTLNMYRHMIRGPNLHVTTWNTK